MKLNVGILRGGFGQEYDISLKSGGEVISSLPREQYRPVDILLTRDGTWHMDGLPVRPEELKSTVDLVFNNLHGTYGEDGLVQQLFDNLELPYTGSGALGSRLSFNKSLAKEKFRKIGLKTPVYEVVSLPSQITEPVQDNFNEIVMAGAQKVFNRVIPPWVIKPLSSGFSVDTYLAHDFSSLVDGLAKVLYRHDAAIVEQYIAGREIVLSVIEGWAGKEKQVLEPMEIIKSKAILDFDLRQSENYDLVSPADLNLDQKINLAEAAALIHESFDLRHSSLVDFILSKNGIYVLEVDSQPGFSKNSFFPKVLQNSGLNLPQALDCIIKKTLE